MIGKQQRFSREFKLVFRDVFHKSDRLETVNFAIISYNRLIVNQQIFTKKNVTWTMPDTYYLTGYQSLDTFYPFLIKRNRSRK